MEITLNTAYSFKQQGKRQNQEDARFPDVDVAEGTFFVVCDGVGGNDAGEVASNSVAQSMGRTVGKALDCGAFDNDAIAHVLTQTYDDLFACMNDECRNMATTMTLLAFHSQGVTMSHIGDSRIYQFRPGVGILYRSKDHSLVQELVSIGKLTEDEARNHPQSNVITRSMSVRANDRSPAATLISKDVEEGDIFLLCTDGVFSEITDEELTELFLGDVTDEEKMRRLSAISYDSSDNNTAYMVSVAKVAHEADDKLMNESKVEIDILPERKRGLIERITDLFCDIF